MIFERRFKPWQGFWITWPKGRGTSDICFSSKQMSILQSSYGLSVPGKLSSLGTSQNGTEERPTASAWDLQGTNIRFHTIRWDYRFISTGVHASHINASEQIMGLAIGYKPLGILLRPCLIHDLGQSNGCAVVVLAEIQEVILHVTVETDFRWPGDPQTFAVPSLVEAS